ncbi:hypothetical protein D3C71_1923450 [compost metagenome]
MIGRAQLQILGQGMADAQPGEGLAAGRRMPLQLEAVAGHRIEAQAQVAAIVLELQFTGDLGKHLGCRG